MLEKLLQPIRIARTSVLGFILRVRVARSGEELSKLVQVVMTTSFLGTSIHPIQRTDEFMDFFALLQGAPPRCSLEIGTASGGSLFLLCHISTPDATLVSVDLPRGPFGGGYKDHRRRLYRSFAQQGQTMVLIDGDSHQPETRAAVTRTLGPEQLDLLIIDGDRQYEGVKADWQDYEPLVRSGGLVAFHDICRDHPVLGNEVARFWEEVSEGKDAMTIVTRGPEPGYGFGIIRKTWESDSSTNV
jgi:cephalosporin hydroxylase